MKLFLFLLVTPNTVQLTSIVLVLILFLLGFKMLETTWSYKISKPFQWEAAVKEGVISKKLMWMERFYRDKVRFYTFWFQIERLKRDHIEGAFAEVGVYKGETAKLLHQMDPTRALYLFDTFDGFAERDLQFENPGDAKRSLIDFADTSLDSVTQYIEGNKNVQYFPGYFPETAIGLTDVKYAMAHLDADLYQPTLQGLRYFYPRLVGGGVIVVHDYHHNWEGVRRAVDEFMLTINETLVFIADWQGSAMIIKNRKIGSISV